MYVSISLSFIYVRKGKTSGTLAHLRCLLFKDKLVNTHVFFLEWATKKYN